MAEQGHALAGVGVDWGCGVGVLSIAAARVDGVDFRREDIRRQQTTYVEEERRGGLPYEFFVGDARRPATAVEALEAVEAGETVLGRWQVHRFRRRG